jgi:hypothetical protein
MEISAHQSGHPRPDWRQRMRQHYTELTEPYLEFIREKGRTPEPDELRLYFRDVFARRENVAVDSQVIERWDWKEIVSHLNEEHSRKS